MLTLGEPNGSHAGGGRVGRPGCAVSGGFESTMALGWAGWPSGGFESTMALEGAGWAAAAGRLNRTISWEVLISGLSCTTGAVVISTGSIFLPSIHEKRAVQKRFSVKMSL